MRAVVSLERRAWTAGLAVLLAMSGFPAWSENAPAATEGAAAGEGASFITQTVILNEAEFTAEIDMDGDVPGEVRIGRSDQASMADEGYLARDVIAVACKESGLSYDETVTGTLSEDGRWLFQKGCR